MRVDGRSMLSILDHVSPPERNKRLRRATGCLHRDLRHGSMCLNLYCHWRRYRSGVLLRKELLVREKSCPWLLWFIGLGVTSFLLLFLEELLVKVVDG